MANRYWAALTSRWGTTGNWSSVPPTVARGSKTGFVVTLAAGYDTSRIVVGQTVVTQLTVNGTVTAQGTVTLITDATRFRTTISSNVAANAYIIVKTIAASPTLSDIVYVDACAGACTLEINIQTANCAGMVLSRAYGDPTSVITLFSTSVSTARFAIYGSLYWGQYYSLGSGNNLIRYYGSGGADTIYMHPLVGPFSTVQFFYSNTEITLLSDLRFSVNYPLSIDSGRFNLNGYALTCGQLSITASGSTYVRPYIDFTSGGSITCTMTNATTSIVLDPDAKLYTVGNGYINLTGQGKSVPIVNIGNVTPPALGADLASFKYTASISSSINMGPTVYAKDFDLGSVTGTFAPVTWYLRGLICPTNASAFTGTNIILDKAGGNLSWASGQTPIINIQHDGTTTLTSNFGDATYFSTLNLISGRLAFSASTAATFGTISSSNANVRGFDFGAGSSIQCGGPSSQVKTWANATNFTVTGTFDLQGGSGVQQIIFGTSGGAVASPNNAPEFTANRSGDILTGYYKKINSNGYAPSLQTVTLRCNNFIGGTINRENTTLIMWGESPFYISGSTTLNTIENTNVPSTIIFEAGTTQTVQTDFTVNGTLGNLVTLNSSSSGTQFSLSKSTGSITCDYLSLQDSNATGGATWTANNSTFGSNVTGWLGNAVTYVKSRFMAFF